MDQASTQNLLEIKNLAIAFEDEQGAFHRAVEDVSFSMRQGEILGLVGESGSGKSVTALSLLRLLPRPSSRVEAGEILFRGRDIMHMSLEELYQLRGGEISMIFQEPMAALSPLKTVGCQMTETVLFHSDMSKSAARDLAVAWLHKVWLSDAERLMKAFPYELSGGMQQRVMIAMAMMTNPSLMIADEPTTALDVTVQAEIFRLLKELKTGANSILLITHDMGAVHGMCDRVMIMYAGNLVEAASKDAIFRQPLHPYTLGLIKSMPRLCVKQSRLHAIPGQVPSIYNYGTGCRFRDRCAYAFKRCEQKPPFFQVDAKHKVACFLYEPSYRQVD